MDQQVGIAVAHFELALEKVAQFAVLGETTGLEQARQFVDRLAGPLLDVRQLCGNRFVHTVPFNVTSRRLYGCHGA